ncbi:hypothetical protein N7474_000524 [Penicillium riverlandense]|uniref:uncharacterized protein n=1 Tax=Penicillium riverlandense TaxID=1903569 RepID=UPI0025473E00|nr:uncharacterized protein N7474_000524 [Penicillium riverlandense]KAJ5832213.1 hypothetical protein N7474_000524 [Penicillium riverlandense]
MDKEGLDLSEDQTSPQVQCSICSSTFRRPEHLKRHMRSHTKEKPFECAQCGRHFSRTDTLHRHELSHHLPGSEGGKEHTHRITVKTFRACFSCATARVRCSGGEPCGRCDGRSLACQYPTERRSKKGRREGSQGTESRPLHRASQTRKRRVESAPETTSQPSGQPRLSPDYSGNVFPSGVQNQPTHPPSNGDQASNTDRMPMDIYANTDRPQPYPSMPNSDIPFSANAAMGTDMRDVPQGLHSAGVDIDTAMAGNLDFDPAFFEQSMLSTINWLPHEFFAGPPNDQMQSSRLPSQPNQPFFPDAQLARTTWQPPVIQAGQGSPSMPGNISQTPSGHLSMGTDMGSPNQYTHMVGETSPHAESVDSAKRSADYYVDGAGARLPKYRRKQAPWSSSTEPTTVTRQLPLGAGEGRYSFPLIQESPVDNISEEVRRFTRGINSSVYDEIYHQFIMLCRNDNPIFPQFETDNFPSAQHCNQFIAFYFESFQAVYPILHLPTFDPNTCHWLLMLAVVAIGCNVANISETTQCAAAFHEMLRRALYVEVGWPSSLTSMHANHCAKQKEKCHLGETSPEILLAMLLNCIGLLHSGSERARLLAMGIFRDLVTFTKREQVLAPSLNPRMEPNGLSQEEHWIAWVRDEIRRRTGYCIWLLDCTLAYYFDDRPLLSLDDGQAALPAHEKLWQADSPESWRHLWDKSSGMIVSSIIYHNYLLTPSVNESLYDAVQIIYIEKRLITAIGEFSHILLIHALYHRMWEVGDYFRRPLSFWNPTAKKQSRESAIPTGSVWLPGIPSYSKWRNSACDCLDILHWTANSTIAKAAGLEHPTVLHLHASRLILLAPFREIRSLATSLAEGTLRWSKRHQTLEWQYIWRWAKHDQYKARLSLIHAGVTLWHVRRYSTNAFHEPVAAFLAVLTLWAYGLCHAHAAPLPPAETNSPRLQGSQPEPSFIHLDRPCDDELVQLFVREGHAMTGNVTGVGDICAPDGPERILRVGCETLAGLTAWGLSKQLAAVLSRMADRVPRLSGAENSRGFEANAVDS